MMASQNKPEKKPTGPMTWRDFVTGRDFEQEYLYAKLKLNKRALPSKYPSNNPEPALAERKSPRKS